MINHTLILSKIYNDASKFMSGDAPNPPVVERLVVLVEVTDAYHEFIKRMPDRIDRVIGLTELVNFQKSKHREILGGVK